MKHNIAFFLLLLTVVGGCALFHQDSDTEYRTLYSTELLVDASITGYTHDVVAGTIKTNNSPTVYSNYNKFQKGMLIAIAAARGNSNAPVTSDIITLKNNVLNAE